MCVRYTVSGIEDAVARLSTIFAGEFAFLDSVSQASNAQPVVCSPSRLDSYQTLDSEKRDERHEKCRPLNKSIEASFASVGLLGYSPVVPPSV